GEIFEGTRGRVCHVCFVDDGKKSEVDALPVVF
ncbi:hypothetical protein A2U01_0115280, partial [Trifolium medium]|nr:hypothetical protein [Trifolium medium]